MAFTEGFGALLPSARYIKKGIGKFAYYKLAHSPSPTAEPVNRVLFVHGVQTPALGMLPLARELQVSFPKTQMVLVDLWGHGLSDTPLVPHDAGLFEEQLDALLEELQWPSVHLVGFSFGGRVTTGYVASRPSKVQSFTLVAPAGLIRSSDFGPEEMAQLHGDDEVAARQWTMQFLEGGDGRIMVPDDWQERVKRGEVVAEAVREWQVREHHGHMASVLAVVRDGGVMDDDQVFVGASRTQRPSLVILGALDDVCPEETIRAVGFQNVFVVPDAGHGVVRDRVPEVAATIQAFWAELGG